MIWMLSVVCSHADTSPSEVEKTTPGATLPAFRVKATVATDARTLFDLLMNTEATPSWAYGVSEARLVKQLAERADLLYLYGNTPWPVRDRDMVVVRVSEVSHDQQTFRIAWHCIPYSLPHRDNVIRVQSCESEFLIRRIDDNSTALDYRVSIDPAGALPDWARRWFARKAPGETLSSIVQRVKEITHQH